jgi:hypothetical protein
LRNSCTAEVKHTSLKYIALHEMLYWEYVHDRRPSSLWQQAQIPQIYHNVKTQLSKYSHAKIAKNRQ